VELPAAHPKSELAMAIMLVMQVCPQAGMEDGTWAATMATAPAMRAIEYCILAK